MTRVAPPPPDGPGEPSNRWPWVALVLGLVVILAAVIFFFVRQPNTAINIEGTPTANPVARASSPSAAPPTLAPPTPPTSAPLAASPTPVPAPTKPAAPTPPPPSPTPVVIVVTATPAPAAAAPPAVSTGAPAATSATAPQATQASPTPATPPGPTAFTGQVSNAGGVGNQRSDLDASLGAPVGETPQHLVVYRKNNFEFRVQFAPDPNGRAALIGEQPQNGQPIALQQAQSEAHKLLPKDAQPPNQTPEGNDQFVVERYTSRTLAAALPPEAFTANGGQPGDLMIVYVKDAQGRITRWIVGLGNDANKLISQAQ